MGKQQVLLVAALAALMFGSMGCARHGVRHHHGAPLKVKHVTVLESEHSDTKVVVVHKRPGRGRQCWKHARHWHCHR